MHTIEELGFLKSLKLLIPGIKRAGEVAMLIQDGLRDGWINNPFRKESDSRFTSALTPADMVVEDMLGYEVLRLFTDAGFYGEEHDLDSVSKLFRPHTDYPYTVTVDPINGTLYYVDGLAEWDIIVTIMSDFRIVGALVYLPYRNELYMAAADGDGAFKSVGGDAYRWTLTPREKMIQINIDDPRVRGRLKASGYPVVNSRTDYRSGDLSWGYSTHGILTGTLCGIIKSNPSLIDSGAINFIAKEAGACVQPLEFDPKTLRASGGHNLMVVGANELIFNDLLNATDAL